MFVSIVPLHEKYLKRIKTYNPRNIVGKRKPAFQQTADNCWIYSVCNNLYFNTGIKVNDEKFKKFMKEEYNKNPERSWMSITSASIICEFVNKTMKIDLQFNIIDIMKDTKLFAEILMKWYAFVYSRKSGPDILKDIADNDEINKAFSWFSWTNHSTCFYWYNKKINELGSRGNLNIYNEFTFESVEIFMECIRKSGIRAEILFLDFKQI